MQRDESNDGRRSPRELLPGGRVRLESPPSGEVTHAPADPRALYSDTGQHYIRPRRRPRAPKWVPGQGVGAAGGGWRRGLQGGRVLAQSVEIPQVQFLDNVLTCPMPCTSGVRLNPHVFPTMWRVASTILNSGVKSLLRACEFQPPGQGGIKILAAWTFQLHTDLGTHSAHCAADRGLSQVQFFGWLWMRLLLYDRCPWLGRAENCGVSTVAVLVAAVQFLDKVVVPVGATTVGRAVLGSSVDTCSASSRVAFGFFLIFYVIGWTRLLRSILVVLSTWPKH